MSTPAMQTDGDVGAPGKSIAFPDGQSALILVAARLRHIASTHWGTMVYLNMKRMEESKKEALVPA